MYKTGDKPDDIVAAEGLEVVDDESELKAIAQKVIDENPKVVADISKNPNAIKFLLGQIMKETRGKANPKTAEKILESLFA